jgi:hypothetical protein
MLIDNQTRNDYIVKTLLVYPLLVKPLKGIPINISK